MRELKSSLWAATGGEGPEIARNDVLAGAWRLLNFSLLPNASALCHPFSFGEAPLYCGLPDSQQRLPPSAQPRSCTVCGGTLTVSVEGADDDVLVDQVFLEPGAWGRYKGLHMHRNAAEWLLGMGTRMLRYGGTFTETVQGAWQDERGPAWRRPPCTAGKAVGGRGGCHLTKLARWSRGWGVLEVLALCEAAGLHCVLGFSGSETPAALAEFVEYAFGDARSTKWGALRAADGHAAPYAVPSLALEVSNEARPAQTPFASRSVRRPLLMPQVNPGSLYRCGKRD